MEEKKRKIIDGEQFLKEMQKKNFERLLMNFKRNSDNRYKDYKYALHSRARNK